MTNSIKGRTDLDRIECKNCHKLFFKGNIQLMLTKSSEPKDVLEIWCDRCKTWNYFTPQKTVLK